MNKFFGLVIMADLSLKRIWMDNKIAAALLKENKDCKIYNSGKDQEAVLSGEEIVWKDVVNEDYVNKG